MAIHSLQLDRFYIHEIVHCIFLMGNRILYDISFSNFVMYGIGLKDKSWQKGKSKRYDFRITIRF